MRSIWIVPTLWLTLVTSYGISNPARGDTWVPGATVTIDSPAPQPYNTGEFATIAAVDMDTSAHLVSLQNGGSSTYWASWTMELEWRRTDTGGSTHIVDSDNDSQTFTPDETGYWQHIAHGTGRLFNTPFLGVGEYATRARSKVTIINLGSEQQKWAEHSPEPQVAFEVVSP